MVSLRFAVIFFAACLLAFLATGTVLFFGYGPGKKLLEPPPPLMTRDEFRNAVFGRYASQVVDAVGPPARRVKWGNDERWYYYGVTRDPLNGRVDRQAVVEMCRGTGAVGVDFD